MTTVPEKGGVTSPPVLPSLSGRHMLEGTIRIFLADALFPLLGVVIAAFLTRRLGPHDYGLFVLATTIVAWIEWTAASLFSRSTIRCISGATEWQPVGITVFRLYLGVGTGAMVLLWLVAAPLSVLLHVPVLSGYLRLYACDVLVFLLAQAQRGILIGTGRFRERAMASCGRAIGRLILVVLFVSWGLSMHGAILGVIGASLTEVLIGWLFIRVSFWQRSSFPMHRLWEAVIPLSVTAFGLSIYSRMDIIALQLFGAAAESTGFYGAAHNLAWLPTIFAGSFSPVLLSTLSRLLTGGQIEEAKQLARDAMRFVVILLPFVGLVSGAAIEVVGLIYGRLFLPAAPFVTLLVFAGLAVVMLSVTVAIMTAAGELRGPVLVVVPLVVVTGLGHFWFIPRFGPIAASLVTTVTVTIGVCASVGAVYWLWCIRPPAGTLWRSLLLCGCAYGLASVWPTPGFLVIIKLAVSSVGLIVAYYALGEFSERDKVSIRSLLPKRGIVGSSRRQ